MRCVSTGNSSISPESEENTIFLPELSLKLVSFHIIIRDFYHTDINFVRL